MTPLPRTTIEFIDHAKDPLAHVAKEVRINGTPVLVTEHGVDIDCGHNEATTVTLTLLPTEVRFTAAQPQGETAMPKPVSKPIRVEPYPHLPKPPSTMGERIDALKEAKPLLSTQSFISSSGAAVSDLIRVAEYITTGHDYFDTHPSREETDDTESESP
jgi:hypothetical protein